MLDIIAKHRSVRQYLSKEIPSEVMQEVLTAATRASTVGTMQVYSMIVTTDKALKDKLAPLHFNQPMVRQAPAIVTFCVDVARFQRWCELRDTKGEYENFVWYVNGAIDALLASENFSLEAQNQGLGICYLGTTIYNAGEIAEILELPRGVVPVTALAVGYPDMEHYPKELTPRLPLEAVVHYQTYRKDSDEQILEYWKETENSAQTQRLLIENELPNLAKIFTERRYKGDDNRHFSAKYLQVLKEQGFLE